MRLHYYMRSKELKIVKYRNQELKSVERNMDWFNAKNRPRKLPLDKSGKF